MSKAFRFWQAAQTACDKSCGKDCWLLRSWIERVNTGSGPAAKTTVGELVLAEERQGVLYDYLMHECPCC